MLEASSQIVCFQLAVRLCEAVLRRQTEGPGPLWSKWQAREKHLARTKNTNTGKGARPSPRWRNTAVVCTLTRPAAIASTQKPHDERFPVRWRKSWVCVCLCAQTHLLTSCLILPPLQLLWDFLMTFSISRGTAIMKVNTKVLHICVLTAGLFN